MVKLPSKGILIENVAACNLACLSCDRDSIRRVQGGAMIHRNLGKVVDVVKLLQPEIIYWFKIGEPFLSPQIDVEIDAVLQASPRSQIICSTNGIPLRGENKINAALRMHEIFISLDGINTPMVRRSQVGGDFDRAYANMSALVRERDARGQSTPTIHWKYVVFRWNDKPATIMRALALASQAGVDSLTLVRTISPPWGVSWRWALHGYGKLGERNGADCMINLRRKEWPEGVVR